MMLALLTACYAEGNSYFLTDGQAERFITMGACEREARAQHSGGGAVYFWLRVQEQVSWLHLV